MAGIPLNTFRTITATLKYLNPLQANPTSPGTSNPNFVYVAPPGTTGIVLYMQVANIGTAESFTTSAWHYRPSTDTWTCIVKNIIAPVDDARIMLGGKLVLQTNDQLYVSSNDPYEQYLQLIVSLLESANQ